MTYLALKKCSRTVPRVIPSRLPTPFRTVASSPPQLACRGWSRNLHISRGIRTNFRNNVIWPQIQAQERLDWWRGLSRTTRTSDTCPRSLQAVQDRAAAAEDGVEVRWNRCTGRKDTARMNHAFESPNPFCCARKLPHGKFITQGTLLTPDRPEGWHMTAEGRRRMDAT